MTSLRRPRSFLLPILALPGLLAAAHALAGAPAGPDTLFADLGGRDFRDFDVPPVMVDTAAIRYPDIAFRAVLEGTVTVAVAVTADGGVADVRVVAPVHPVLDRTVLEAVRARGFRPATRQGRPVPGITRVDFPFDHAREAVRRAAEPERPPVPWSGAMVRDVANRMSTDARGEVIHWRDGVAIHGEMSVAALDTVLARVARKAPPGERISDVWTRPALRIAEPWAFEPPPDIRVETCRSRRDEGWCSSGKWFGFMYVDGDFALESTGFYFKD